MSESLISFSALIAEMSVAIRIHLLAALGAIALLIPLALMKKGTPRHKGFGRAWVALMMIVAISSFWIHDIRVLGDFSPIHLISIFTIGSMIWGIYAIRHRNRTAHVSSMIGTAIGGLGIAGLLSIAAPGRLLFDFFFTRS